MATYERTLSPEQLAAFHARMFDTFVTNQFGAREVQDKAVELIGYLKAIVEPTPARIEVEVRKPGRPKKDV